jgi:pimeloyl-ACP methyl ester carboxylesterase
MTIEPLAIDKTVRLDINGTRQRVRVCAARAGLPPLLIVQAGPAWPLLHEVRKFQRLLNFENDFLTVYWEQRGCGDVPGTDATNCSLQQQVDDLRAVLRWLYSETSQRIVMLGISIGGTFALQAAEHARDQVKAIVAISPDSQTTTSDTAADAFLREQGLRAASRGVSRRLLKLEPPPYTDAASFARRARLLADLGTIEWGKTFGALAREMLVAMAGAYGVIGTLRALRNMDLVQRKLLPEIASMDLFAKPPRVAVPVHFVYGEQDVLNPASIVRDFPALIAAPSSTVARLPNAGHMAHFDQPAIVRSIAVNA